jgi:gas vesicle protein GvpL/GvpF
MPLLAYCIAPGGAAITVPSTGIQGAAISHLKESGLQCFFSDYQQPSISDQPIREAALAFNHVLQEIFQQVAVIPFRFPTVIATREEISAFLQEHATEYGEALARLRTVVQMELHIGVQASADTEFAASKSGAEYLRNRQSRHRNMEGAARKLQESLSRVTQTWRQREVSGGLRCYVLVEREAVRSFLDEVSHAQVPATLSARVSGPWPPTEFLKKD